MICLVLTGASVGENLARLSEYRTRTDLVELRADFLSEDELPAIARFPSLVDLPAVLAVRRKRDGGRFTGDERARLSLIERGLSGSRPYSFVELEDDLPPLPGIEKIAGERGTAIIRSLYAYGGIPPDFGRKMRFFPGYGREIRKAVVAVDSAADLVRLYETSKMFSGREDDPGSRRLLAGVGPAGVPSLILSSRFGSLFTYAEPPGMPGSSGMLDPQTLEETYRFRKINRETKIFGIIGRPVLHTRSPGIHNPAFGRVGFNAVYVPFQPGTIDELTALTDAFDIRGLSVTVPFKEAVLPYLSSMEEAVRITGACNTVIREGKGWIGYNTDIEGFLAPLLQRGVELSNLRALVIGAGGAARSAVYALASRGSRVLVLNRTPERARILAEEFGCDWGALDAEGFGRTGTACGLVVQTTSSGMSPHEDEDPSAGYAFTGKEIAYDLVYKPVSTRFLARASEAGCRIIGGEEMLLGQACRQFLLFSGSPYPREDAQISF